MEAGMSSGIMTGPYDIPVYHARAITVATNKSPLGPYRGVGRSGACFAIETLVDAVARAVNREPADVRVENMVPPEAMPYSSATHKLYDSGDYPDLGRFSQVIPPRMLQRMADLGLSLRITIYPPLVETEPQTKD